MSAAARSYDETPTRHLPTIRDGSTIGVRLTIPQWWAIVTVVASFAFGAGCWATWMSFKMETLSGLVVEMRADIRDLTSPRLTKATP